MSLLSNPIKIKLEDDIRFNEMNSRSWIYSMNEVSNVHIWRLVGVKLNAHKYIRDTIVSLMSEIGQIAKIYKWFS